MTLAVTFDYGQTLAELDTRYLAKRALERDVLADVDALDAAGPKAWGAYNAAKVRGESAFVAWSAFMTTLLRGAGVRSKKGSSHDVVPALVDFLWSEQPKKNLWRRPIEGMDGLVRELSENGVPLGIVSNSEGKLRELVDEMGFGRYFPVVADSGVLGFEKPDRRIFDWTAERLGVSTTDLVHVGDAFAADVEGALGVGAVAIWFTAERRKGLPSRVLACSTAGAVRTALTGLGILP
ncbi:MAG TPA: HAD-IA family hydrolase [Polyangiaceae bacterium]|jgi:putative hydrolase of the HAD superfamily|nr:HAD-IA family hydrolase [Polyangiaceae bacterium]